MAGQKTFGKTYTYNELFDTQKKLDSGELAGAILPAEKTVTTEDSFAGIPMGYTNEKVPTWMGANKENLGSILGQVNEINADRKRRLEQESATNQGMGKSILSGGSF